MDHHTLTVCSTDFLDDSYRHTDDPPCEQPDVLYHLYHSHLLALISQIRRQWLRRFPKEDVEANLANMDSSSDKTVQMSMWYANM